MQHVIDLFLHLDKHLEEMVEVWQVWTYVVLALVVFCETGLVVTPILPGDSLLFAAGALAALDTPLNVHLLFLLLAAAAILGDTVNYAIGAYLGPRALKIKSRFLNEKHIERTQAFFDRYGGMTIILARFVPIVRTFAPFLAGVGTMNYGRFIAYNIVGGTVWVAMFVYLGYFFGNLKIVKENFSLVVLAIIVLSVLPIVREVFLAWRQDKAKTPEA
ncbi:MAG: DedA family protein [Pirellulales bacterium]|nr:DedA family protein [Pirellulales bacterium]